MKKSTKLLSFICIFTLFITCLSSCSDKESDWNSLKIGVSGYSGELNPFYAGLDGDKEITNQVYMPLQRLNNKNKSVKYAGGISYEYIGDTKVKYIVTIEDDLFFSDGTNVTIDDVIFWYYVLADASYDGPYSDFYQNDIEGLKEYYYDDKNYKKSLSSLVDDTEIQSYIDRNYNDGIDIDTISGIKRVDDYTCTILYNSRNINAVSEINAFIVSKAVFSKDYIKGSAQNLKNISLNGIGCGPYCFTESDEECVTLTFNKYFFDESPDFKEIKFIDITDEDPYETINKGKADIVTAVAVTDSVRSLDSENVSYDINTDSSYSSLCFNVVKVDNAALRMAVFSLYDCSDILTSAYGSAYSLLSCPISSRFEEYPSFTESLINPEAAQLYSLLYTDNVTLNAYCSDEKEVDASILNSLKEKAAAYNITINVNVCSENDMIKAVNSCKADLWIAAYEDNSTCDKYDYYHTGAILNKTGISDEEIDKLTERIRKSTGFVNKAELTSELMQLVMEQGCELPLYQLQKVTAFRNDVVDLSEIDDLHGFDGPTYIIPYIKATQN